MYSLLADAVIIVHFLFILFVVAGGLLILRWPQMAWLHLPAVCWGAFIEFAGWICPLTPLENHLRRLGGEAPYTGDFVVQYLVPVIYPAGLNAFAQYILGGLVIAVNLMAYALVLRRRRRLLIGKKPARGGPMRLFRPGTPAPGNSGKRGNEK